MPVKNNIIKQKTELTLLCDGTRPKRARNREDKRFTHETRQKILALLRAGNFVGTAVHAAGISNTTYYRWMIEGAEEIDRQEKGAHANDHSEPYAEFYTEVRKAIADAEIEDVKTISMAAETQWQAAAWRLERKFKRKWGKLAQITGSVDEKTGDRSAHEMSDEELMDIITNGGKQKK